MKKVLIIDDDPVSNFVTKLILKESGIAEVTGECFNGQEGMNFIKKHIDAQSDQNIDLIFLDLNMPIMDGWQFLEEYIHLKDFELAPIYILSSSNYDDDVNKAKKYPIVKNYLVKPLRKAQIHQLLEAI